VTHHSDSTSDLIASITTSTHQFSNLSTSFSRPLESASHRTHHCGPRRRSVLRRSFRVALTDRSVTVVIARLLSVTVVLTVLRSEYLALLSRLAESLLMARDPIPYPRTAYRHPHSTCDALPRLFTLDRLVSPLHKLISVTQHLLMLSAAVYSASSSRCRLRSASIAVSLLLLTHYIPHIWIRYRMFELGGTRIFKIMIFISITCIFMILWDHKHQ
jgi:hypothetical protein